MKIEHSTTVRQAQGGHPSSELLSHHLKVNLSGSIWFNRTPLNWISAGKRRHIYHQTQHQHPATTTSTQRNVEVAQVRWLPGPEHWDRLPHPVAAYLPSPPANEGKQTRPHYRLHGLKTERAPAARTDPWAGMFCDNGIPREKNGSAHQRQRLGRPEDGGCGELG